MHSEWTPQPHSKLEWLGDSTSEWNVWVSLASMEIG